MTAPAVFVAHEKHGVVVYASACAVLRKRIADGYWYADEDAEAAQAALAAGEAKAFVFLDLRSDYEYELVERREPIS